MVSVRSLISVTTLVVTVAVFTPFIFASAEERVVTTDNLNVREPSGLSGVLIGMQSIGSTGSILSIPLINKDGFTWVPVDFDKGPDGWVANAFLSKTTSSFSNTNNSTPQVITEGARVMNTENLNARQSPGLTSERVTQQPIGGSGTVLPGTLVNKDGYTWVPVKFDSGIQGWVAGYFLRVTSSPSSYSTVSKNSSTTRTNDFPRRSGGGGSSPQSQTTALRSIVIPVIPNFVIPTVLVTPTTTEPTTPPTVPAYDPALIEVMETRANEAWAAGKSFFDEYASSGSGLKAYSLQYVLKGSLDLYEATGKVEYFARALVHSETLINHATIVDDLGYKNWANGHSDTYTTWTTQGQGAVPTVLYDLQATTELARLAVIAHNNNSTLSFYRTRALSVGSWVESNIFDKWEARNASVFNTYSKPLVSHDNVVVDTTFLLARLLTYLEVIEPDSRKSQLLNNIWNAIDSNLATVSGTTIKLIDADQTNLQGEVNGLGHDTSHYNRYTWHYSDMVENGHSKYRVALDNTVRAFNELIYDELLHPRWTNFVDGHNTAYGALGPFANGNIYLGNDRIGQWNQTAQENLLDFYNYVYDGGVSSSTHNWSVWGKYALPAGIARNIKYNTGDLALNQSPTPTAQVAGATITKINRAKVSAEILRVRFTPSLSSAVLGMAPKGLTGIIKEGPVTQGGHTWYNVHFYDGSKGWISDVGLNIQ